MWEEKKQRTACETSLMESNDSYVKQNHGKINTRARHVNNHI